MTDAHCHVCRGETRHFLCDPTAARPGPDDIVFFGYHPWQFLPEGPVPVAGAEGSVPVSGAGAEGPVPVAGAKLESRLAELEARLVANPRAGVGEIGLDRLKVREIPAVMRAAFEGQLALAANYRRPVVLHGAKCWGQVVAACRPYKGTVPASRGTVPAFLFHGFSRSGGLIPEIVALNGYISVGPAVLNDHAVNYRELVKAIPLDRLLVESDATETGSVPVPESGPVPSPEGGTVPSLTEIVAKIAEIREISVEELTGQLDANVTRFLNPS